MSNMTFLEHIKVDQQETVMANILAYYFNPQNEHGLGTIFIEAFLKTKCYKLNKRESLNQFCADDSISQQLDKARVFTELATEDGKRIDIFIKNDEFALCIEFKINHVLNNDLNKYKKRTIEAVTSGNEKISKHFFAILTPDWRKPEFDEKDERYCDDFKQVMLGHFIETVEDLTNERVKWKSEKQRIYYKDFIQTIKNRRKIVDAFERYQDETKISKDNSDYTPLDRFISGKVKSFYAYLENKENTSYHSKKGELQSVVVKRGKGNSLKKVRLTLKGWQREVCEIKTEPSIEIFKDLDTSFEVLKTFINS